MLNLFINHSILPYLLYAHGVYNFFIFLALLYQSWLGLKIRKERTAGKPPTVKLIRRHRNLGPIMILLGIAGFLAGAGLAYTDKGHILEYPLHFFTGLAIVFLLIATFFISVRIKGRVSPWRTPHFFTGIIIIGLYIVQIFLGLDILF